MKTTLSQNIHSAKMAIISGWKLCLAGQFPEDSVRDRIKHFLFLKSI
jgi:hypothetical protein